MTRVAVLGVAGRMGRLVVASAAAQQGVMVVAGVARPGSDAVGQDVGLVAGLSPLGIDVVGLGPGAFADADVIIDFSLPEGLDSALPLLDGQALVTGTTGLTEGGTQALQAYAARAAVLPAANFSTGVTLLLDLVARAAQSLPDARIEIVETHHRHKRDAPSGTALALGRAATDDLDSIGFHSLRGGDVVGDHTVHLLLDGERLELSHRADSRATFAAGAVRAARWLATRGPGMYTMRHVLGLQSPPEQVE